MVVDNLVLQFDKRKIQIISGDLKSGLWQLDEFALVKADTCGKFRSDTSAGERVELEGQVKSVEIEKVGQAGGTASALGAGAGAMAGLRFYGLPGAIGGALVGHFLAGGATVVRATVVMNDGRKFLAAMSPVQLKRLTAIANRG